MQEELTACQQAAGRVEGVMRAVRSSTVIAVSPARGKQHGSP